MEWNGQFKKTAFGGFDREDVLRFFSQYEEETKEKMDALSGENQLLKQQTEQLEQEKQTLSAALASATAEKEEMSHRLEALQKTCDQTIQALKDSKLEYEVLSREMVAVKSQNSEFAMKRNVLEQHNKRLMEEVETLKKKVSCEELSVTVGEIVAEAKVLADGVVGKAVEKASEIEKTILSERVKVNDAFERAQSELNALISSYRRLSEEVVNEVDAIQKQLTVAREEIGTKTPASPAEGILAALKKENDHENGIR